MFLHPDDLLKLAPNNGDWTPFDEVSRQRLRGFLSGLQRKIKCVLDCAAGPEDGDRNWRRRQCNAADAIIYCIGLIEDAKRDDPRFQRFLRRGDGWLSSMLRMCKSYGRKALFWNRGNMLDAPLPDFKAIGMEALGLSGGESLAEVLEAARKHIAIEPHTLSNPSPQQPEPALGTSEDRPVDSKKPEYSLTYREYMAVKRLARRSELRLVAGRLADYKRRGDLDGFIHTLYGMMLGKRVSVGGNKSGVNERKRTYGKVGRVVMSNVLLASSSVMDALARVTDFMVTGEMA